jgi:hypothetical protein
MIKKIYIPLWWYTTPRKKTEKNDKIIMARKKYSAEFKVKVVYQLTM